MNFSTYNYRFAEEILNSKLHIKREIENIIKETQLKIGEKGNQKLLQQKFKEYGWEIEPSIIQDSSDIRTRMKMDCIKERVGVEIEFAHHVHVYHEWLKFLVAYEQNIVDVAVQILYDDSVKHKPNAPLIKKASRELESFFKSVITIPIYIIGIK
jgi:hypothetical protein